MNYSEWKPLYKKIVKELNISKKFDKKSRNLLNKKINPLKPKKISEKINKETIIFGNAPSLKEEIKKSKIPKKQTKIVADSAIKTVKEQKIKPDIIVTDLDGYINLIKKTKKNTKIVVHAHGDNIKKIKKHIEDLNPVLGTTQAKPLQKIHNFGGFTDGDRATYLAEHFGAKKINMLGFDFNEANNQKLKKLKIAKKLLNYLEKTKKVNLNYID